MNWVFLLLSSLDMNMKNLGWLVACIAVVAASFLISGTATAQCATCPTPVVAYSPVVYNTYQTTYDDGWYLGKFIGRLGRRVFGTAPAPAVNYTAAYPMTYAAAYPTYTTAYAPTYAAAYAPAVATTYATSYAPTYAASYAPACTTCGVNPCSCCTQTTYRPVVMQPVVEQAACCVTACPTCDTGVVTTSYGAPAASTGCANCTANYGGTTVQQQPTYAQQPTYGQQPPYGQQPGAAAGNVTTTPPPSTFREQETRLEPTPAHGTSTGEAASNWEPPQLFGPGDKQVRRPTTNVRPAVYEQGVRQGGPATQGVSTATTSQAPKRPTITWVSGSR